jgi:hypothetical protein
MAEMKDKKSLFPESCRELCKSSASYTTITLAFTNTEFRRSESIHSNLVEIGNHPKSKINEMFDHPEGVSSWLCKLRKRFLYAMLELMLMILSWIVASWNYLMLLGHEAHWLVKSQTCLDSSNAFYRKLRLRFPVHNIHKCIEWSSMLT